MRDRSQQQSPSEVVAALPDLVLHPAQTFYHGWNWKAALLSAMLRAPLFLIATLRQGLEAVFIAVFAEGLGAARQGEGRSGHCFCASVGLRCFGVLFPL